MKRIVALAASAVLAFTMCACSRGSFGDTIDPDTGAYEVKAEKAGKNSSIGALGGLEIKEGQGIALESHLTKGEISVRVTDDDGNVVFEKAVSGSDSSLNGIASGEYNINFTCTKGGTNGSIKVVPVDEDVYNEQGGDIEKTLAEMKIWSKANSADEAAKGAEINYLSMPADDIELENGKLSGWTYKYESDHVKATGFVGAAKIVVDKGIYAGDGDISDDVTVYANHWNRQIKANEINCYGQEKDKASKVTWVDGNYMYSIVTHGQGENDTFGLSEADVTALVSAIA